MHLVLPAARQPAAEPSPRVPAMRKRTRMPGVETLLSGLGAAVLIFLLAAGILSALGRRAGLKRVRRPHRWAATPGSVS